MREKLAVVLVACSLVAGAACSGGDNKTASSDTASAPSEDKIVVSRTEIGKDAPREDDDEIIERSIDDVERFWAETYPTLYQEPYRPVAGGKYAYSPSDPPPSCGGDGEASYDEVAENAFYCPVGDFVAWDTQNLTDKLLEQFGPFTLGIVVAHEMGHAVQDRHGILRPPQFVTFLTEQQADCFAGAYVSWVADGNSDLWELRLSDLDQALGGFLQIRDPVGTDSVNSADAHGSAFQRINAFEDGLVDGAARCKEYEEGNLTFVPEVFTSEADLLNEGNLPLEELLPAVVDNLNAFWVLAFEGTRTPWTPPAINPFDPTDGVACGGETARGDDAVGLIFYCPEDDSLNWDDVVLLPYVWDNIGDMGDAVLVANLFSLRAQHLAELETDTLEASLQADCFSGVWVATTATGELSQDLTISPGDLDEVVASFLEFSDTGDAIESGTSTIGSAFQRLDAFRAGFKATFDAYETTGSGVANGFGVCLAGGGASAASSDTRTTST